MCQHINRKYRHVLCEWESRTNLTHTYTHTWKRCCSVWQSVAVRDSCESYTHIHTQTHTHGSGVAACCRVLQCAASCESHTHIHTQTQTHGSGAHDSTVDRCFDTLHLQRTTTHCNMLQHRKWSTWSVLQSVAVCCSALQCVAMWCSVLQCVVVCRSVLQRVAAFCSVFQCVGTEVEHMPLQAIDIFCPENFEIFACVFFFLVSWQRRAPPIKQYFQILFMRKMCWSMFKSYVC